jgi:hypothetical protein
VIRELARLAALGLSLQEAAAAFLGGAAGGALAFVSLHLVNNRWPTLLDPLQHRHRGELTWPSLPSSTATS